MDSCASCKWSQHSWEHDDSGDRWRWVCWAVAGTPADRAVYYAKSDAPPACCEHTPRDKPECGF